jgi:predicted Zn-dependent protease
MESVEPLAERYARARMFSDAGDFVTASRMLAEVVTEEPDDLSASPLFAPADYHSAQLHRAEAQSRAILRRNPAEEYAHLLLGRTLQRQSRHAEAAPHLRIVEAMSGQTTG